MDDSTMNSQLTIRSLILQWAFLQNFYAKDLHLHLRLSPRLLSTYKIITADITESNTQLSAPVFTR